MFMSIPHTYKIADTEKPKEYFMKIIIPFRWFIVIYAHICTAFVYLGLLYLVSVKLVCFKVLLKNALKND